MSSEIRVRLSPVRCPYCKGPIEKHPEVVACAACGARHHEDCRAEHGRCAVCGATELLVFQASPPGARTGLQVTADGAAVVYRWRILAKEGDALVNKDAFVRLEERAISFTAISNRTIYVERAPKLVVRGVALRGEKIVVTLDGGDATVATSAIGPALTNAERDRLRNVIETWLGQRGV